MKIIDIALKDLLRSSRSLYLVGMSVVAPLLLVGLIYFAFGSMTGGDVSLTPIRVGVVTADTLPPGAPLDVPIGQNIRDMFFDASVRSWITAADYASEAAARAALDAQSIDVALLIPSSLTANILAGTTVPQTVILQDPTLTIAPDVVRQMVTSLLDGMAGGGIAFQTINARQLANGLTPDPAQLPGLLAHYSAWYIDFQRALFHTPEKAALVTALPAVAGESGSPLQAMMGLVVAGQMIFFSFFTGAYAMNSILQEDEEGTLARLFTTPTNRTAILAGKFLAVLLTVLLQGVVLMLISRIAFGVNWGAPASAALALLGQIFAAVGLAVLIIAFVKTSKQTGPVLGGVLTGLGMLSGLFTTNIKMPEAFNAIGNFTPQGWVLKSWKLVLAGQPAGELVLPFIVLLAMGVVMFVIGAVMFRKRFA